MKEYTQCLPIASTTTTRSNNWTAVVWVIASSTGMLPTRLLLTSSNRSAADALLLLHIILALVLYIYNYGFRIFLCVPAILSRPWRIPINVRPRVIASVWIYQLWRALYAALAATSLMCGYRAVAELQNLPIAILLMQVDSLPHDLWFAFLDFAWTWSMCSAQYRSRPFDAAWLGYQVCSVIGFCYFGWQCSRTHLIGVGFAIVSSVAAGAATMLHRWIAEDIIYMEGFGLHGFEAVVLAINALIVLFVSRAQVVDLANLLELFKTSGPLVALNIATCVLAVYISGGVFRCLRTRIGDCGRHWTDFPISFIWSTLLLVFEMMTAGSTGLSTAEVVIFVVLMVGKRPVEGSYRALAVICDVMGDRLPWSIPS